MALLDHSVGASKILLMISCALNYYLLICSGAIMGRTTLTDRHLNTEKTLTIHNKCNDTVWLGSRENAGALPIFTSASGLKPGDSINVFVPISSAADKTWSGRLWGQPQTGPIPAQTPVTLAELNLNGSTGGFDWYDVSIVDGFNLPMLLAPKGRAAAGGGGKCSPRGCIVDILDDRRCPAKLRVISNVENRTMACMSACSAFGEPPYCCTGEYATREACEPSLYSQLFKQLCPQARTYAFDDRNGPTSCSSSAYELTFCPSSSSAAANQTRLNSTNEFYSDEGGTKTGAHSTGKNPIKKLFQEHPKIALAIIIVLVIGLVLLVIVCSCGRTISIAPNHLNFFPVTLFSVNSINSALK